MEKRVPVEMSRIHIDARNEEEKAELYNLWVKKQLDQWGQA